MTTPRTVLPTLTEVVSVDAPPALGAEEAKTAQAAQGSAGPEAVVPTAPSRHRLEQLCLEALQRELEPLLQTRLEESMAPAIDCAVDVLAARLRDQVDLLAEQLRHEMRQLAREAAARAAASLVDAEHDRPD